MPYSQKPLIDLFLDGQFPGETGRPKHIQTVISNVFIFESRVYKCYKIDNVFFNKEYRNLADNAERFSFTKKDFVWNNALSPSIYKETINIAVRDGKINLNVPEAETEEIVIAMNRVDTKDVLYEKLAEGKITENDCFNIGKRLGVIMKNVQAPLPQTFNFYEIFDGRIKDYRSWICSMPENISLEEASGYADYLEEYRKSHREWFEQELTAGITKDGDFTSYNCIYSNETFHLMDTYPPKDAWGIGHSTFVTYRIGTDIWAISGRPEFFEAFVKGYEEGAEVTIDRRLDDIFILYAGGIAMTSFYMLSKNDPNKKAVAQKYHTFMREQFAKVK